MNCFKNIILSLFTTETFKLENLQIFKFENLSNLSRLIKYNFVAVNLVKNFVSNLVYVNLI